jgi:hypothetical protein
VCDTVINRVGEKMGLANNSPPLPSSLSEEPLNQIFLQQPQGVSQKTHIPITVHWTDMNLSLFGIYGTAYLLLADTLLFPIELMTTRLQADTVKLTFNNLYIYVCGFSAFILFI